MGRPSLGRKAGGPAPRPISAEAASRGRCKLRPAPDDPLTRAFERFASSGRERTAVPQVTWRAAVPHLKRRIGELEDLQKRAGQTSQPRLTAQLRWLRRWLALSTRGKGA